MRKIKYCSQGSIVEFLHQYNLYNITYCFILVQVIGLFLMRLAFLQHQTTGIDLLAKLVNYPPVQYL